MCGYIQAKLCCICGPGDPELYRHPKINRNNIHSDAKPNVTTQTPHEVAMQNGKLSDGSQTIGGIIFVCFVPLYFIQTSRSDRRQPPLAVIGPLKMASGGGYLRQTLRTMSKRHITYQSGVYLGFDLVDVDLDGSACQPPW
jgi:hypothetical protein